MKFLNQKNLLYLTTLLTPLYFIRLEFFHLPTNLLEIFILLNLCTWLCISNTKKIKTDSQKLPWPLVLSISLILLGITLSIFSNNAILIGLGILKGWFILPLVFAYLLLVTLANELDLEKVLFSFYFSTTVVAIVGLFYKAFHLVTFDNRLSAFYLSPNQLAMYLAPGALIGFYFLAKTFQKNALLLKYLTSFSLAIILLALFYTYSYATWAALCLSLLLTYFFYFSKKQFFLLLIITTGFLLLFTLFQLNTPKFSSLIHFSERSSLASRLMIWQVSAKLLAEKPLTGIGPGNFQASYLALQPLFPPYLEWAVPQPHNLFLAFWLQAGFLGLLGFSLLLFFIFYALLKKIKKTPLAGVLFSFFLYLTLHGLVDTPFWKNDLAFVFWIFVAIFGLATSSLTKNNQC
jgi:putative inorganic carbon (hco3(-)) transporter